ncbi:hypothetical protein HMPREF3156_01008, partial [Neisseria sp. HMSC06F02]
DTAKDTVNFRLLQLGRNRQDYMMQRYRNQRKALSFLALVYGVRLRQAKK